MFFQGEKDGDDDENSVKLDSNDEGNRINLLCLMMKLSDVGSTFQHVNTSKHWIHNFYWRTRQRIIKVEGQRWMYKGFWMGKKFFNSYIKHLHSVVPPQACFPPPS